MYKIWTNKLKEIMFPLTVLMLFSSINLYYSFEDEVEVDLSSRISDELQFTTCETASVVPQDTFVSRKTSFQVTRGYWGVSE